jgi:hypothetical protein
MRKWQSGCVKHAIEFIDHTTPTVGLSVKVDNKHVLNPGTVMGSIISEGSAPLPSKDAARLQRVTVRLRERASKMLRILAIHGC